MSQGLQVKSCRFSYSIQFFSTGYIWHYLCITAITETFRWITLQNFLVLQGGLYVVLNVVALECQAIYAHIQNVGIKYVPGSLLCLAALGNFSTNSFVYHSYFFFMALKLVFHFCFIWPWIIGRLPCIAMHVVDIQQHKVCPTFIFVYHVILTGI